jgi:hypothetical protein
MMRPTKENSQQEEAMLKYLIENRRKVGETQAFYKTCTDFLKANPAETDDISSARLEIEDILLNDLHAYPSQQLKAEFEEFVTAASTSFSPRMASHIKNSHLDKLDREIASLINGGADKQQITDIVLKICDVVHVEAKLPAILTEQTKFGVHGSFTQMIETLPEKERAYMKATLASLVSWDVIMSQHLYKVLGINETKKNPPSTNLMKRAKLSVTEAFAVLSRSHLKEFFGSLLETTDQEFARAGSKIGASSYASAVHNLDVSKHFEESPRLGA